MNVLSKTKKVAIISIFTLSFAVLVFLAVFFISNLQVFSKNLIHDKWPWFFMETLDDESHLFPMSISWFGFFVFQGFVLWILSLIFFLKNPADNIRKTVVFLFISLSLVATFLYSPIGKTQWFLLGIVLGSIIFVFENFKQGFKGLIIKFKSLVLSSKWIVFLVLLISIIVFFNKISWVSFDKLIWTRDYGKYFYLMQKQIGYLLQGTLYGWNNQFSGGYPTFLDLRYVGFLLLPFKIFGDILGFKLLIISLYITGPVLTGWVIYNACLDKKTAFLSMCISCVFWIAHFGDVFYWGTIPGIAAINLFLISLSFYLLFLRTQKTIFFALFGFCMAIVFYVHPLYFAIYSFVYLFLFGRDRKNLFSVENRKVVYITLVGVAVMCLPKFLLVLLNRKYIIPTFLYYKNPLIQYRSFKDFWIYLIVLFSTDRFYWLVWLFLPIVLISARVKPEYYKNYLVFFLGILLIQIGPYAFTYRIKFLFLIVVSYLLARFLVERSGKHFFSWMIIFISAGVFFVSQEWIMPAIKEKTYFSKEFLQNLREKPEGLIIYENAAYCDPHKKPMPGVYTKSTDIPHLASFLAVATGRNFISHYGADAYPYFIFREGSIAEGTWDGVDIKEVPIQDVYNTIKKWGVCSVVVFSPESKRYFSRFPDKFDKVYEYEDFIVYNVKGFPWADILNRNSVKIHRMSDFKESIRIKGAKKGQFLILKKNFFPYWQVKSSGKRLETFSENGLLAFKLPHDGNVSVELDYPKMRWTFVLFVLGVLVIFIGALLL